MSGVGLYQARVAAALEAGGVRSFVGDPPDNVATPFTFVWGPSPIEVAGTAGGCGLDVDLSFHVQVVADQPASVLVLADRVKDLLRGLQISLDGWTCFPLTLSGSTDVQTARGVVEPSTNQYPAWLTLHCRFQATKG